MSYIADLNLQPGERGLTRDEGREDPLGKDFLKYMKLVISQGMPIVVASGNHGDVK